MSNQYPINIIVRKYFLVRKALDFMGTVVNLKDKKILPHKEISSKFCNYQIPQLISNYSDKSFFLSSYFFPLRKMFSPWKYFQNTEILLFDENKVRAGRGENISVETDLHERGDCLRQR